MSERAIIDTMNASVTIIEMIATGLAPKPSTLGTATGFFFESNDRKFLVTNRHVVINERIGKYPDNL